WEDGAGRDAVAHAGRALELALESLHRLEQRRVVERARGVALHDDDERLAAAELLLDGAVAAVELGLRRQDARRRAGVADLQPRDEHGADGRQRARGEERGPAAARAGD